MQRRSFLKLSALTFTSLLGQAGCRGGGGDGTGSDGTGDSTGGTEGAPYELVEAPERFPQSLASGDPKESSVVLWTRVEDLDFPEEDYEVDVEIWMDPQGGAGGDTDGEDLGVTTVRVTAEARFDHCVKVRVEGLEPGTSYRYRFIYVRDGLGYVGNDGLTRTAPASDADVPVRFGFVSCQDYTSGYYNAYAAMLEQQLDFFVHLGDYIYETADDSSFQGGSGDREVSFDDEAGALELPGGDGTFFAAKSLDNYRQLYRTYRSDPALRAVHETIPMIAIWDDHEFSDDCHGANATYRDGREDELDPDRRAAANQAWFEYMPVDYPDPEYVYDPAVAPPDDIRIYRDIEYGQHVHMVMTDLRSYRPDHIVPEDAYPGAVAMDEAALAAVAGDTTGGVPYVDIDAYADGDYATLLRDIASAEGYDPALITGLVSAPYINEAIEDAGSGLPLIEQAELDTLPRGLAYHQLFKTGLYGQIGARYLLVQPAFRWLAQWRDEQSGGAAQSIMGEEQRAWFLSTMQGSSHTWKIWGNEFCLTPLAIDLTGSALPETFRQQFTMSAEDWNGAPHERGRLIDALASVDNVVAITGDIHSFFAGTPFAQEGAAEGNRVVELVVGAVSSTPYSSILVRQVQADPGLSSVPGIEAFALGIKDLLQGGPNPQMGYANPAQQGFAVVQASSDELLVEFFMHPEELKEQMRYDETGVADGGLAGEFDIERFRVVPGSRDLFREIEGAWAQWDPATRTWV